MCCFVRKTICFAVLLIELATAALGKLFNDAGNVAFESSTGKTDARYFPTQVVVDVTNKSKFIEIHINRMPCYILAPEGESTTHANVMYAPRHCERVRVCVCVESVEFRSFTSDYKKIEVFCLRLARWLERSTKLYLF